MISNKIIKIGQFTIFIIQEIGKITIFCLKGFYHIFSLPIQFTKIISQIYFIGLKSLIVILLTSVFTGMVLGLQGYYTLVKFGSEGLLGAGVALSIVRELGPVLTAIMIIGRAGSAIAAEIGIMRIYEQIDSLETMNIDPIRFIVAPKFAASLISFPILTAIFDIVGIYGGYLTGSIILNIEKGVYFSSIESSVNMDDIVGGFIKSFVFAIIVITICSFQGYNVHRREDGHGAKGVSLATTSSVVISCVIVLIVDYVITSFLL